MKRYPSGALFIALGLLLTLVPGAPATAAPSGTRISGIKADTFDDQNSDPFNPAHPLFSTADNENVKFVGHIDTPGNALGHWSQVKAPKDLSS